jgi:pyridoxal 5'-phosphate synthase pdxS subunit
MTTDVLTHEQSNRYEVQKATWRTKVGLAEMLRGGVIMDVVNAEQAQIAEEAGAVAVMALERVPADIRREGGVARMSDPVIIEEIMNAVTIPVMAKCRIGHFAEAMILEALGVDFIDESEVLTPADEEHHINKHAFKTPFVCGARDLGEALRRIGEGAAMIRTKGEAGTGNIVEAVRHMRAIMRDIRRIHSAPEDELMAIAKQLQAPYDLVVEIHQTGRLPVPNFSAGGIATPADAALMMWLGAGADCVVQPVALPLVGKGGAFAAGDNQRVVGLHGAGLTHLTRIDADSRQHRTVFREITLQGTHADGQRLLTGRKIRRRGNSNPGSTSSPESVSSRLSVCSVPSAR